MQIRIVVLLLAASLVVPGLAGRAEAQTQGSVVVGMAQEPDIIGPFSTMAAAGVIHNSLFSFFAPFNEKWIRQPVMVTELPTLKNGQWKLLANNKMQVTWNLKRGFTWHDGRSVTALDVRFTYGMLRHPKTPTLNRVILRKIDNVVVPNPGNPYAFVVQWNERYPFANSTPTGQEYTLPRHLLESAYLKDPEKLKAHRYFRAPVGNGPYKFVEWVPGSHISLEAVPNYPMAPKVQRVTFRFILDSTVLTANQIAGTVDVTEINNFGVEQMIEIEQRSPGVATHYTPALTYERINFNLDNEWFKDKRVRQAIAHAIDRAAIFQALFRGKQPVAHTWLPSRHPASNDNVKKYAFDLNRAKALLAEAGFTPGPDGILRDRAGKRFEFTYMTTAGNAPREQTQQIVKEQLRQVGIEVKIDNRPASVFFGTVVPRREFPHIAEWATVFTTETLPFNLYHSMQIPRLENNWEGSNRVGWRHADNDKLVEQIEGELDEAMRTTLLKKQQELFAEELPELPLYFRLSLTTSKKTIKNVRPTGLGGAYINWNSEQWALDR